MRTPVFSRPKDNIYVRRLATGKAVVRMYTAYIETPYRPGMVDVSANMVETVLPDRPDLEAHVLRHWDHYYQNALQEEIAYLYEQYEKAIGEVLSRLPPGKKDKAVVKADDMIRKIAHGDRPFVTKQDFARLLKNACGGVK